jgi:hypothetical protein
VATVWVDSEGLPETIAWLSLGFVGCYGVGGLSVLLSAVGIAFGLTNSRPLRRLAFWFGVASIASGALLCLAAGGILGKLLAAVSPWWIGLAGVVLGLMSLVLSIQEQEQGAD